MASAMDPVSPATCLRFKEEPSFSPVQKMSNLEDDNSSLWSVQVNVSSPTMKADAEVESLLSLPREREAEAEEHDEDKVVKALAHEDLYDEEDEENEGEEDYFDLCDDFSSMNFDKGEGKCLPKFMGKHKRFVYNSDDEIEKEEEVFEDGDKSKPGLVSPSVTRLNGLPTPAGKHLRFVEKEAAKRDTENEVKEQGNVVEVHSTSSVENTVAMEIHSEQSPAK